MKTISVIFICLMLAGCAATSWSVFEATDPAVAAKLEISEKEWREIQKLASQEDGWVPLNILRREKGVIEIDFRKANDPDARQGGIVRHYSKQGNTWKKLGYDGAWGYMIQPLQKPEPTAASNRCSH